MNLARFEIFIAVSVSLLGCLSAQNVPQSSHIQSQLFSEMITDLKKAYEAKLNNVHRRLALQEERYNDLLEILRGSRREFLKILSPSAKISLSVSPDFHFLHQLYSHR